MRTFAQPGLSKKGCLNEKKNFFFTKIVKFRPCAEKTDAIQMFQRRGRGGEPRAAGRHL